MWALLNPAFYLSIVSKVPYRISEVSVVPQEDLNSRPDRSQKLRALTTLHDSGLNPRSGHSVAPPLREIPIALIHGVNALRHRALAASRCPGPKDCRL